MSEGTPIDGKDHVFAWRDRVLLQPVCMHTEEEQEIFLVVDDQTGELIFCGPDLMQPEMEVVVEKSISREASLLLDMHREASDQAEV